MSIETMTDREILELAAKAAGYETIQFSDYSGFQILDDGDSRWWDPLADDGDAFRLAVKLKIDTRPSMSGQTKFSYTWKNGSSYGEVADDPLAATRRAIVRAAAEIGKENK